MLFISSFLLPLAVAALIQLSLAAPATSPRFDDVNTTIARYIIRLNPNAPNPVPPTEADRRKFLMDLFAGDFDAPLNHSLVLSWDKNTFNGFSGRFNDSQIDIISHQEEVAFVAKDIEITPTAVEKIRAPWNIARLTSGATTLSVGQDFSKEFDYIFNQGNFPAKAYVIDTGCFENDKELGRRAAFIGSFGPGDQFVDLSGHGTLVTRIIGGGSLGVAKQALVNCIKISKETGADPIKADTSDFISAIDLALATARTDRKKLPSVILAAWQSPPNNNPLETVVSNAIKQGIPVIVAAGNDHVDVSTVSPAGVPGVITVAAATTNDTFASFSNFGPKVTIVAPGEGIVVSKDNVTASTMEGTSFAAAHVAGLSLVLMSQDGKQLSSKALTDRLTGLAVRGAIKGVPKGTPNLLLAGDLRM